MPTILPVELLVMFLPTIDLESESDSADGPGDWLCCNLDAKGCCHSRLWTSEKGKLFMCLYSASPFTPVTTV